MEELTAGDLVYVSDNEPGIRRKKARGGFRYQTADGDALKDIHALARIKSLAIPPAWTDVWICTKRNGHLQATGRDAKGRKQYRYHPHWRQTRDRTKFEHTVAFGKALPRLRATIESDLRRQGLSRAKVLATVVQLLELTLIRVGNDEYRKSNNSFGLTTLRNRHLEIDGNSLHFEFRGKSGKSHSINLRDRRLARIVRQVQEIPGHELFQYLDDDGNRCQVSSGDVNAYLREAMGADFTAKDFRTWAGTVLAAERLGEFEPFTSQAEAKRNLQEAIVDVAGALGNTPTICRKCYVHPDVTESYLEGRTQKALGRLGKANLARGSSGLNPVEKAVLRLLQAKRAA